MLSEANIQQDAADLRAFFEFAKEFGCNASIATKMQEKYNRLAERWWELEIMDAQMEACRKRFPALMRMVDKSVNTPLTQTEDDHE